MSSYPTLQSLDWCVLFRYSVFMVLMGDFCLRSALKELHLHCTTELSKRKNARQPPAFPEPRAPVSSAGSLFTVVFGMGTGVSYCRITTGQNLLHLLCYCASSAHVRLQALRARLLHVRLLIADHRLNKNQQRVNAQTPTCSLERR